MTISISLLVIGCSLLFLSGIFVGISIMCMLSVRKSRRFNEGKTRRMYFRCAGICEKR